MRPLHQSGAVSDEQQASEFEISETCGIRARRASTRVDWPKFVLTHSKKVRLSIGSRPLKELVSDESMSTQDALLTDMQSYREP
nr:unnamed protein product [Spirometra erinaceieuropaei]